MACGARARARALRQPTVAETPAVPQGDVLYPVTVSKIRVVVKELISSAPMNAKVVVFMCFNQDSVPFTQNLDYRISTLVSE